MSDFVTPLGLISFPHLFTPRAANESAEPRYSAILLFDDAAQQTAAYKAMKKAVRDAIAKTFTEQKANDPAFIRTLRLPFRDASEKQYQGYEPGRIFIQAWNKEKPDLVDIKGQDIILPKHVWAGAPARFSCRAFAYNQSGNKGVSFALNSAQVLLTTEQMENGHPKYPRLDGRKSARDTFANEELPPEFAMARGAAEDGPDDEIPF